MDSPHKWTVVRSIDIAFLVGLDKLLNKQLSCQWLDIPWHCNVTVIWIQCDVTVITCSGQSTRECSLSFLFLSQTVATIKTEGMKTNKWRKKNKKNLCSNPFHNLCWMYLLVHAGTKDSPCYYNGRLVLTANITHKNDVINTPQRRKKVVLA